MQAGGSQLGGLGVANATAPLRILQGVSHHAFVGCILVIYPLDTAVAADAVLGIVD